MKASDPVTVLSDHQKKITALLRNPRVQTASDHLDLGMKADCVDVLTGNAVKDIVVQARYTDLLYAVRVTLSNDVAVILPQDGMIVRNDMAYVSASAGIKCFGGLTVVSVEPAGKMRFIQLSVPAVGNVLIDAGIYVKTDTRRR